MPNFKITDEQTITSLFHTREAMERQSGRRLYWRDVFAILIRIYETAAPKELPTPDDLYDLPARARDTVNAYQRGS